MQRSTVERVRRLALGVLLMTAAAGAARSGVEAQGQRAPAASPYTSAKVCGECHQTIHLYWSESPHAQAASRPSFRASLESAMQGASDRDAVRRGCTSCHAPTSRVTGDHAMEQELTREGVTCDFCHTVYSVQMDAVDRFESKPGRVKYGPLLYAKSESHDSEYSALHKASPLLCAACHEYKNANGVAVMSNYSEWQASPYRDRGITCQECHMPTVPGRSVREGLTASDRVINLHRVMGGSLAARVQTGVELKIAAVDQGADSARVDVTVTNSGVGHAVPGGLPSNSLVLSVAVETGPSRTLAHQAQRVYRQRLVDAKGRALVRPAELFLDAVAVGEDTRLRPKESRTERFTLPIPPGATAILARLEYKDESDPQAGARSSTVGEERRPLAGRR